MTDEDSVDPLFVIQRLLERQDAQHPVRGLAHGLDPPGAPRPDRRADVVRRADAGLAQFLFQPEIEIGSVDADKHVRRRGRPTCSQRASQLEQPRNMRERLDQAHDREFFGRGPGVTALLDHCRTGYAFERGIGHSLADCTDEPGAQQVTGCLASNQSDAHLGNPIERCRDPTTAAIRGIAVTPAVTHSARRSRR